jgi:hypothetical protein
MDSPITTAARALVLLLEQLEPRCEPFAGVADAAALDHRMRFDDLAAVADRLRGLHAQVMSSVGRMRGGGRPMTAARRRVTRRSAARTCAAAGFASMGLSGQKQQSQSPLVGTWKLLSFESQSADGEISHPFGEHAHGLLMYDSHGRMSVVLTRADRPTFVSGDPARGTPEEIKAAFDGFSAYCGTYNIDNKRRTVTHHVEANSFPNWVGTDQQRFFTLSGRRLTLRAPPLLVDGQTVTFTAVWERVD